MAEKIKSAAVGDVVQTVGLRIERGRGNIVFCSVYELTEKYTIESAGVLRLFPTDYNFYSGRTFQNGKDGEIQYLPVAQIIVEFHVKNTPYYVSDDNFHNAVERAILMRNYIQTNKLKKEKE